MYVSYMSGIFDFTGTQMVLTMKLTSFAYNMYDGTADKKNVLEKTHEDKKLAKVYQDRARFAITKLPSPLEFFGYVYCFTCILAGPAFEYKDYERAIDKSAYRKSGDSVMTQRTPSSNFLQGLHRLLVGVVCLVGFLQLSAHFTIADQLNVEYVQSVDPVTRFARLMVAIFAYRLKFYFAWKVAEGASVMAGFGFEGYDNEGREKGWRGVENVDILSFESSSNMASFTRHWNKRTQGWLE
jgi:D-alanyl-lipoteichoic acid acyltransferase DltB (MBOAT superfamily)